MKIRKGGFTIIEVSLFLAITGLLFLGVTIGVQNSIFQQRYNDSVQNFAEFLRSAYAKVENVQGKRDDESGKKDKALYGKLITFSETKDLTRSDNNENKIFIYDIVGEIEKCNNLGLSDAIEALKNCGADVKNGDNYLGLADSYTPKWSAAIQNTDPNNAKLFSGALIIVRHPQTGTVNTYVMKDATIQVNNYSGPSGGPLKAFLSSGDNIKKFTNGDVDFCINPNGNVVSKTRTDVRIKKRARNASAVEVMPVDGDENKCVQRS